MSAFLNHRESDSPANHTCQNRFIQDSGWLLFDRGLIHSTSIDRPAFSLNQRSIYTALGSLKVSAGCEKTNLAEAFVIRGRTI